MHHMIHHISNFYINEIITETTLKLNIMHKEEASLGSHKCPEVPLNKCPEVPLNKIWKMSASNSYKVVS